MNFWILFPCAFILFLSFKSSNTVKLKNKSKIFSQGINEFSAEFYQHLAKSRNDNFVSSPISVAIVAAMAAYGAAGNTKKELSDALHLPLDRPFILKSFRNLITDINTPTDIELHLASKLYLQNRFPIKEQFKCITSKIFMSEIQSVDFQDATKTAKIINDWCMEKTNNKITNFVTPDSLTDTELIMINAVYFKAKWMYPFKSTTDAIFHLSETKSVQMSMMSHTDEYNYGYIYDNSTMYIEVPYQNSDPNNAYSMFILIPKEINGVNAVGDKLHKINFAELNAPTREVKLYMPRFKIESELDLEPIFKNMGIRDLFTDKANFSQITQYGDLQVTDVIQKAYINVAEAGTEAAAVTVMNAMLLTYGPETIYVDRPFISAIVSKNSGTPLFWTRVMDPGPQTISSRFDFF